MPYRDRINAPWPKKLLALDGSGIRGVITLEVLRRRIGLQRRGRGQHHRHVGALGAQQAQQLDRLVGRNRARHAQPD